MSGLYVVKLTKVKTVTAVQATNSAVTNKLLSSSESASAKVIDWRGAIGRVELSLHLSGKLGIELDKFKGALVWISKCSR
jgi:hypothetical protein